nr:hypothetical protein CTI12_AA490360 [Tanacetum cinerariifolium]
MKKFRIKSQTQNPQQQQNDNVVDVVVPQQHNDNDMGKSSSIDANANANTNEEEDDDEDDDDDDFIMNEVKRRLKELRRNSFMVLIPEEEEETSPQEEQEDEEDEAEANENFRDVEAEGRHLWSYVEAEGRHLWSCFGPFYDNYCQRMLFFDHQTTTLLKHIAVGSHHDHSSSTPSPRSVSKKLTSPLRCLSLKKFEHPPQDDTEQLQQHQPENDPYLDLETSYVSQLCLTWEALHCQDRKDMTTEEESEMLLVEAPDLLRIIESSILTFQVFVKMDKKKKSNGVRNIFGGQNQMVTPLQQVQSLLDKRKMKLKELWKKRKGSHHDHSSSTPSPRSVSKKLTSPLRCLSLKKFEHPPQDDTEQLQPHQPENDPYLDLETSYVSQLCLTWEALHCQDRKDMTTEEESEMLLVEAPDLLRIIESSILTFQVFVKMDKKKKSNGVRNIFGGQNQMVTPLQQVQSLLDKRKMKLKELWKKRKGGKKNQWPATQEEVELLLALIDVKVISRVLRMVKITKEQLFWSEEKMKKLHVSAATGKLQRDPSPILFPC